MASNGNGHRHQHHEEDAAAAAADRLRSAKLADLSGPGVGSYAALASVLPSAYSPVLGPRATMQALFAAKAAMETELCRSLQLFPVQVPLVIDPASGVNDGLDRDGSRSAVSFAITRGLQRPLRAEVVQAATKWKRMALAQFQCQPGEGVLTDMRAIRKDYFLDHDHSCYVDQWDWEQAITAQDRTFATLKGAAEAVYHAILSVNRMLEEQHPELKAAVRRMGQDALLPDTLTFLHAQEVLDMFPSLPRKARETELVRKHKAVFIWGIGAPLSDGLPHENRAADYDDWVTPVSEQGQGEQRRLGLNGDILVWNPITQRRHELTSMGVRVDKEALLEQMRLSGREGELDQPYHQAILQGKIPLSVGGGIGQSRLFMLLLRKAHLGEVSVSVWPKELKALCAEHGIPLLE